MSAVSTPRATSQASPSDAPRPDAITLACFAGVVLFAGSNVVAVRYTIADLDPFWGAGVRFGIAGVFLFAIAAVQRLPFPRGRALAGALIYGFVGSFAAYAFLYVGLKYVPASLAAPIMASVPLITFFLALAHRVETFRWRGLAGGVTSLAGIAILSGGGGSGGAPLRYLALVMAGATCAAETGIILKKFPRVHPIMINAIAMTLGSTLLFVMSFATGEEHALPQRASAWLALGYLIVFGSTAMFILYVTVINRWTVTGASYQFVLFPLVAILLAALLIDEPITASLATGGALVLAGVYVGALSGHRHHPAAPAVRAEPAPCAPPC